MTHPARDHKDPWQKYRIKKKILFFATMKSVTEINSMASTRASSVMFLHQHRHTKKASVVHRQTLEH